MLGMQQFLRLNAVLFYTELAALFFRWGSMKQNYAIHKDFSSIAWFKPPFSKLIFPMASFFLGFVSIKSDEEITVSEKSIASKDGSLFKTLLIEPKGSSDDLPCMVYMPGGGFAFKAAPYHYYLAKEYCTKARCKVLLVQYRLAPKYKFPLALEDCCSAYEWVLNNAKSLGVDKDKIAIGGDSAGGNLAAACTLMVRDKGLPLPRCQMLIYPVVDASMKTDSMKKYTDTPMWNAKLSKKMWEYYLPSSADKQNPYASLLCAKTLSGLPATYIEVAEYDCLHDEGVAYAEALKAVGVPVTLRETKGTIHGFEFVSKSPIVAESVKERTEFLARNF